MRPRHCLNLQVISHAPLCSEDLRGQQDNWPNSTHKTFESWLGNTPGLKVISCVDPLDAKGLMETAIRDNDPVCIMESEVFYAMEMDITPGGERAYSFAHTIIPTEGDIPAEGADYTVEIGKAAIRRTGSDVTIVTYNKMIWQALLAAQELAKKGSVLKSLIFVPFARWTTLRLSSR